MAEQFGDKTEAPTAKRKQKAHEDGQVLRSRDFATALVVLAGCAWMAMLGPSLLAACKGLIIASLQFGRGDIEEFSPTRPLAQAGWQLAPSLAGLFAVALLAGVTSQAGLGALQFNPKLMAPKPS
ncbi:MAG: EscU/YscU/HrcU family type III secretion system export apparatus switch protein, partial [Sphingomonadaceae bacterium]|nr:EscU/YscU/HrcU family type III secretion system export apparatus switch protein [Sphingomonadaceae bacterium]